MVIAGRGGGIEPGFQMHGDVGVIENGLDHRGIALFGHALELVEKVVVVVVEAHRQALEDRCGEFGGRATPLFFRVAFEEGLVEIGADEFQRLVLEGLRLVDRAVADPGDERSGLVRAHRLVVILVDRMQVDRQRENLPLARGFHPVLVGHEIGEGVDVIPHLLVIGMEDMGAIDMYHDAGFRITLGVAVAADMIAPVDDGDGMAGLGQLTSDYGPGKTRAYKENVQN